MFLPPTLILAFLTHVPRTGSIECINCFSDETGEDLQAECEAGTLVPEQTLDCETHGWGSGCITRLHRSGVGADLRQLWLRSCVGAQMTCEEGYQDLGDGTELW